MFDNSKPVSNNPVIKLTSSPHAKLQSVPTSSVSIPSGFWGDRLQTNRDSTIPYEFEMIKEDPAALLDLDRELGARNAAG